MVGELVIVRASVNFTGTTSMEVGVRVLAQNPVTGEEHMANVDLPDGFIWTRGRCGKGSFHARAGELSLNFDNTNWILYDFDWTNAAAKAA